MTTRREALVNAGLAKPGRGKFSKEANAWLDKERASGAKFSDDDQTAQKSTRRVVNQKNEGAPAKESSTGMADYVFPSEYRFPEDTYRAFKRVGGKKVPVSLREVCNTCRVSLVNHGCESPTIHGSIAITIEKGSK